jgi:hypothetical protein
MLLNKALDTHTSSGKRLDKSTRGQPVEVQMLPTEIGRYVKIALSDISH